MEPMNKNRRGVALIVVLGALMLLSMLVLAFLSGVSTELKSSKLYADGAETRFLAQSSVNLVLAQIKTATAGVTASGRDLAWVSQPGMIRTYDRQGSLERAYKLYSSDFMSLSGTVSADLETQKMVNWKDRPAHFTDLNKLSAGVWPVMDPNAEGDVEGFSFSPLPTGIARGEMPVEWLYVLKNGEIIAPDNSVEATGTAIVAVASADNPIIGRIAFWTDDETCKVNINTASEGTFWDTPRVFTEYERKLGRYQPVKNEFQRYPGHPATVSLRTALPAVANAYEISPRYVDGGSKGGTVSNITTAITPKRNRLYASIDEILFDPDRELQGITKADLSRSRFFLTANSRAPEVNLFNQPRIAMWPVHQNLGNNYRTVQDQLIAFCSSIGGYPYYLQRANPDSPTADIGQIPRNRELFQYLQRLTGAEVPGFGGNFLSKYGVDRDQILTEILDYIRCTNLNDQGVAYPFAPGGQVTPLYIASGDTLGFGRFPTVAEVGVAFALVGNGNFTVSGSLATAASAVNPAQYPPYPGIDGNGTPPNNTAVIQAYLVMSFMSPAMGYPSYSSPRFTVSVSGLDSFTVSGTSMGFPNSGSTYVHRNNTGSFFGHVSPGGGFDPRWLVIGKIFNAADSDPLRFPFFSRPIELTTQKLGYLGTYFNFRGGTITVNIYAGDSTAQEDLVQTLEIPIYPSAVNLPLPFKPEDAYRLIGTGISSNGYGDRFAKCDSSESNGTYRLFGAGDGGARDTVVTVALADGDARIAFKRQVPGGMFAPIPGNANSPNVRASFCANSGFSFFPRTRQGKLVKDTSSTLFYNLLPAFINGVNVDGDSTMPPGDWDNGIATISDGAYINKPDEGDLSGMSMEKIPYFEGWGNYSPVDNTYFSPNRQVPSSGMLGSLPTGVKAGKPWRTLLFRPDPSGKHPGGRNPPDHLFMDFFWMPVIEPYPISEPFSTAGKINMNYQIMPFSFINRETGVRAALKSGRILAVPQSKVQNYKNLNNLSAPTLPDEDFRMDLDLDETLEGFRRRFQAGDLFRSASEICDIHLVPAGQTYNSMNTFWDDYLLSGDNSRERPYANFYPCLTTKSNTFTVYYKVQVLQKRKMDAQQDRWIEGTDRVLAEHQGATLIERYIDPNDDRLPAYATNDNSEPLGAYYKFRVLSVKQSGY
jgi:hypothetical protein